MLGYLLFHEGGAPRLKDFCLSRLLMVIFPPTNYFAFDFSQPEKLFDFCS
jgi:hypothetical protein